MRHASFFSGVGGLDLGFERAGIHTVSVSEIDPYANAVLAERFPSAPNLGSITEVNANDIPEADIWSGGFPCQDLSVAGKRAGFAGKRSSLAFTFLDLVEQRRPRWLVLENVPGLFSSNKGADFGRLLYEMEQLRYGVSWRTLDARYFGVAQRRRRVFLVASLESDRAGEVLFECEGCERHPSPRWSQRQGATAITPDGSGVVGALPAGTHGFPDGVQEFLQGHFRVVGEDGRTVGASPNSDGVRAADGLARRLDDQQGVEDPQRVGNFEMYDFPADSVAPSMNALRARDLMAYQTRVDEKHGNFSLSEAEVANSPSALTHQQTFIASIVSPTFYERHDQDGRMKQINIAPTLSSKSENSVDLPHMLGVFAIDNDDPLLPVGLDSHRYRCCGNGVVAPVAEWIGRRIVEVDRRWREGDVANTLNSFDVGDVRTTHAIVSPTLTASNDPSRSPQSSEITAQYAAVFEASEGMVFGVEDDPLLPLGLDSHRYRCCGNGVVAPVAEWIGRRIVEVDRRWQEEGK